MSPHLTSSAYGPKCQCFLVHPAPFRRSHPCKHKRIAFQTTTQTQLLDNNPSPQSPHLGQPVENLPVEIIDEMGQAINLSPNRLKAWKPKGCIECENTGYRGRVAVYEFFLMNDEIADLITPGVKASALRQAATEAGWRPLRWHGWPRVQSGLISIEELQRISGHINQHYLLAEDLHEG